MGDWFPASPSPRAFFPSMISDDVAELSIVNSNNENKSNASFPGADEHSASANSDQKDQSQERVESDETSNPYAPAEPQLNSRGGLMERIAARAGFNAPRLNTESIIRPAELSKKPAAQSPLFAVSPGLSPTTLLESPVFLTNSLAWPSPTTGKFLLSSIGNNPNATTLTDGYNNKAKENHGEDMSSSFAFQPVAAESAASFHYSSAVNKPFPSVSVSTRSNISLPDQSIEPPKVQRENNNSLFEHTIFSKSLDGNSGGSNLFHEQTSNSIGVEDHSSPFDEPHEDGDQSTVDPNVASAPAEDGYNWRKYGQKHVKGSEYPRSYYKCTYPNCPVKKKVERSHEGHITEIIYKGTHNHPKPAANRRSAFGLSNGHGDMQLESEQTGADASGDPMWSVSQNRTVAGPPDWRANNPPLGQENGNGVGAQYGLGDGADGSCTFSNDEEDDDRATYGSVSLGNDGEGDDEFESKRRRIETYAPDVGGASRALREPRVVVQTTSEVDILDDGYRWRKYGQKVVKGNPNPRSYYKCTSAGCNVRKHVERASHDLKSVITTYEGKHNHDVPAARNSGHTNPGGPNAVTNQQSTAVNHNIHRPDPSQIRGTTARFGRPPIGSFGIQGRPQLEPGPGFGFGMNQPGLASMGLGGLLVHPYFGNQPRPGNDMRYMVPKGEPKLEPVTDIGPNSTIGSTVHPQQVMSRLQLGPQM